MTKQIIIMLSVLILTACSEGTTKTKITPAKITQIATDASSIFTNAYIIELEKSVVVVDATLTVSASKGLRAKVDAVGKPLVGVFVTHGHPDHYNGLGYLTEGTQAKIYSTQGVYDVIAKSDAAKEEQWTPMFGDEWPRNRVFPNKIIKENELVEIDGVAFKIHNVGPGESHHDTYITMEDGEKKAAFVGDIVLHEVHAYVTDGHLSDWFSTLDNMPKKLKDYDIIYPGHGKPGGLELFQWQKKYLDNYVKEVKVLLKDKAALSDEDKNSLTTKMQEHLPNDKLLFLIGLGADAVVSQIKEGKL